MSWWQDKPRSVSVLVDNPSWVLPYAQELVARISKTGDCAQLCRSHLEIAGGDIAFFIGCIKLVPRGLMDKYRRCLVVHASDLPKGRGFSPWSWQILDGESKIPICLLNAADDADAGDIVYKEWLSFEGHELVDDIRSAIGQASLRLCLRFLAESAEPPGSPQVGSPTVYRRRNPSDSKLDPNLPISTQFSLLRIVDNEAYPAYFEYNGYRYKLAITKLGKISGSSDA